MMKKIVFLIDENIPIESQEKRKRPIKSEIQRLWADNTKAKKKINWEPKFTLEIGLNKTIKWISENINFYKTDRYRAGHCSVVSRRIWAYFH